MTEKKKLKLKIFDKEYSLLVENEEIATELAKYVNDVISEIKKDLSTQPTETIAIIAALNIAYDLFMVKNKHKEILIQSTDRIKKLKLLLDNSQTLADQS